jgi:hypothetical protein
MEQKRRTLLDYDVGWRYKASYKKENGDRYVTMYKKHLYRKWNKRCAECEAIFNNNSLRIRIEAIILTGLDIEKISEHVGICKEILQLYSKLFFDIEPIKNIVFKKIEIAEACEIEEERLLKTIACREDANVVLYLCGIKTEIDTTTVMNTLNKEMLIKALYYNKSIAKENVKTNLDILKYTSKIFIEENSESDAVSKVVERLKEKFFDEE